MLLRILACLTAFVLTSQVDAHQQKEPWVAFGLSLLIPERDKSTTGSTYPRDCSTPRPHCWASNLGTVLRRMTVRIGWVELWIMMMIIGKRVLEVYSGSAVIYGHQLMQKSQPTESISTVRNLTGICWSLMGAGSPSALIPLSSPTDQVPD